MSWDTVHHVLSAAIIWGLYFYWRKYRGAK